MEALLLDVKRLLPTLEGSAQVTLALEEILGGQVIDETGLPGIYGFELKERLNTPEALIQVLRDEAGLVITRDSARYRRSSCGNGSGI